MSAGPKIPFHMEMTFSYGEMREIWPGVRRIVAENPSPMTQNGTNTYIVGQGEVAVIDPGPECMRHLEAILSGLDGETITHIFLSHTHKDHYELIPALKAKTGAKVCAFRLSSKDEQQEFTGNSLKDGKVDYNFQPDIALNDGDWIEGETWSLKAIHTPGHTPDHLCFEHGSEPVLFSGDHVMAWNTSVIIPPEGRMSDYLNSLKKILGKNYERLLPGHGGQARTPERLIKAYLMHRRWRETAIFEHIQNGLSTIDEMIPLLYPNLKPEIIPAASLSILAHAEHLKEQGKVISSHERATLEANFTPAS